MKKTIIIAAIIAATFTSCTTTKHLSNEELDRISWTAFCHEYGYNTNADTEEVVNEYLDCWRGSVAEEQALAKLGIAYE